MSHSKEAMHEALGSLRKTLRDRTGKKKLFTISVEQHAEEQGEPKLGAKAEQEEEEKEP